MRSSIVRRGLLAVVGAAGLLPVPLAAQQPPSREAAERACRDALAERLEVTTEAPSPCFILGTAVVAQLTRDSYRNIDVVERMGLRAFQPTTSGNAATGGSAAQAEAVPTVQPLAIGGGSIAAVGADSGAHAITALTINPAVFFTSPSDRKTIVALSRLTDLTVLFPVDELDADEDGRIDYFGVRLRLNATGVAAGNRLLREAQDRFEALLSQEFQVANQLESAFLQTPNLNACVDALLAEPMEPDGVGRACGESAVPRLDDRAYEGFRSELAELREAADARYLGLDLRLDYGDPTLGGIPDADAVAITGGVAFGRRILGSDVVGPTAGVKGRLGVRYVDLRDVTGTDTSLDGGLAIELRRGTEVDLQRVLAVAGGFEFRYGGAEVNEAALRTDFLVFRATLAVPLTEGTLVSLNVGAPLLGTDLAPSVSISGNWNLLLPGVVR